MVPFLAKVTVMIGAFDQRQAIIRQLWQGLRAAIFSGTGQRNNAHSWRKYDS